MTSPTHRIRRGKLVKIPEEWQGHVTHPQTQRKRPSHFKGKLRKEIKFGRVRMPKRAERQFDERGDDDQI